MRDQENEFPRLYKRDSQKVLQNILIIESRKLIPPLTFSPSLPSPLGSIILSSSHFLRNDTRCCSRARIKISCEKLRELVPGITLKTDKATVFEFAVEYLAFLKRLVGPQYDKVNIAMCHAHDF